MIAAKEVILSPSVLCKTGGDNRGADVLLLHRDEPSGCVPPCRAPPLPVPLTPTAPTATAFLPTYLKSNPPLWPISPSLLLLVLYGGMFVSTVVGVVDHLLVDTTTFYHHVLLLCCGGLCAWLLALVFPRK
jgi:hypothetical protein